MNPHHSPKYSPSTTVREKGHKDQDQISFVFRGRHALAAIVCSLGLLVTTGCVGTVVQPLTTAAGSSSLSASLPTGTVMSSEQFGMHINSELINTGWPSVPFGTWRLWDSITCWYNLEPSRGDWEFGRLDALVALGQQHNEQMILTLGQTPTWASARPTEASDYSPGAAAPPMSEQDWIDYVTTVVRRYKGRIEYYEIWNEPNLTQYWTGTPSQLIAMQKDAYEIVHAEDPSAQVISPSVTAAEGIPYFQSLLQAGMAQYSDVIGYHLYVLGSAPEQMVPLIEQVQASLLENGVAGKQVWNTETGWALPNTFPDPTVAAAWVVRAHLVTLSNGVARFAWYAWDNRNWVTLMLTDDQTGQPTPAATAYTVMQRWLVGATLQTCAEDSSEVWRCPVVRNGKQGVIVWHANSSVRVPLPVLWKAASAQDALGNPVALGSTTVQAGDLPVLISQ